MVIRCPVPSVTIAKTAAVGSVGDRLRFDVPGNAVPPGKTDRKVGARAPMPVRLIAAAVASAGSPETVIVRDVAAPSAPLLPDGARPARVSRIRRGLPSA